MPTSLKWIMPDDYEWLVAYELEEQDFNNLASASELEVKVAGESFTLVKDFKEPGGVMDPVLTHTYVTPEGSDRVISVAVILDRRKLTATFNKTTDSVSPSASVDGKQDKLVSGENIKTINGQSILGPGDLTIEGTDGYSYSKAEADERFASKEELVRPLHTVFRIRSPKLLFRRRAMGHERLCTTTVPSSLMNPRDSSPGIGLQHSAMT